MKRVAKNIVSVSAALVLASLSTVAQGADLVRTQPDRNPPTGRSASGPLPVYKGHVSVIDGRTLWYPKSARKVRLSDIDTCELPQWALNPKWVHRDRIKAPAPVPCGALAKAWLKRVVANTRIDCTVVSYDHDGVPLAVCRKHGRDIALTMLKVGWARVSTPSPVNPRYLSEQQHAIAACYGMWKTYVLDINEWRRKAVDKTLHRQPIADFNLLSERQSEISPPFRDAGRRPPRTDK